mmetsp:Transcript_56564/g.91555  ORF Transcript_56564/g.91555 Transcript_56564/m.91555 type:complete len:224 (-) Transcript_56564:341-1012(-)
MPKLHSLRLQTGARRTMVSLKWALRRRRCQVRMTRAVTTMVQSIALTVTRARATQTWSRAPPKTRMTTLPCRATRGYGVRKTRTAFVKGDLSRSCAQTLQRWVSFLTWRWWAKSTLSSLRLPPRLISHAAIHWILRSSYVRVVVTAASMVKATSRFGIRSLSNQTVQHFLECGNANPHRLRNTASYGWSNPCLLRPARESACASALRIPMDLCCELYKRQPRR